LLDLIKKNIPQFKGAPRSIAAKKNIFLLFVFNGFNFLFNIILVRLTLDFLGQENYGIWITLASVLTWFNYLDFGLGNGLRNKLTEAFAKNDLQLARIYVSTTYVVFSSALVVIYILFLLIYKKINWTTIFNTSSHLRDEMSLLVFYVFTFFTINFILKLITFIVTADQKPAINGLFSFSINFLSVVFIYLLIIYSPSSLITLGAGSSLIPVIVFFAASVFLFRKKYKKISPSLKLVNLKYSKELIGLGFQFFVIQAATLIVLATDNMIITQLFGPDEVAVYNIAYRYFNYIPIIFFTILNPLWSAYTDAYVKEDVEWIKNTVKKILKVWAMLSVLVLLMITAADVVYNIWLDSKIKVPFILTILMGIFAILSNWNNIFAYFINGVGKIRLSLFYAVFVGIINIPLSILLAKNAGLGISGVIAATLICLLLGSIYSPVQYFKIINKKDTGIWGK
jgi:O-antigen/teichoic acid export membrane protein